MIKGRFQTIQLDEKKVEELYKDMAVEAKLSTFSFPVQADAEAFLQEYRQGKNFEKLGLQQVELGKAEGANDGEFIKLVDLLPAVAKTVFEMEPGAVSEVFQGEKDYLVFRLEAKRVYEDAKIRQEANSQVFQQQARERQEEFFKTLEEKYVTFHKDTTQSLDFAAIVAKTPG